MATAGDVASMPCAEPPSVTDFTADEDVFTEFRDGGPDRFGRRTFFAHWIADNVGPRIAERGVLSQIYSTQYDAFVDRQRRHGSIVRTWPPALGPDDNHPRYEQVD